MSKTLQSFGRVLFDELEQLAARRGGFASLDWVCQELKEIRRRLETWRDCGIRSSVAGATPRIPSINDPRESRAALVELDRAANDAAEALLLALGVAEAVEQLGHVVDSRVKTALKVLARLEPPAEPVPPPASFFSLMGLVRMIVNWIWPPPDPKESERLRERVGVDLPQYAETLQEARRLVNPRVIREQIAVRDAAQATFVRTVRLIRDATQDPGVSPDTARAAARTEEVIEARRIFDEILAGVDNPEARRLIEKWPEAERLLRGAAIRRSRALIAAMDQAIAQVEDCLKAYRKATPANQGVKDELWKLIEVQAGEARYVSEDIIEDGARATALRLETVGLAFSGGGIRSATFNLGMLQGLASLGLLRSFDYLSTVSGGGYIGSWFAAWVRREGGRADPLKEPLPCDVERAADRLNRRRDGELDAILAGVREELRYRHHVLYSPNQDHPDVGDTDKPPEPGEDDARREYVQQQLDREYRDRVASKRRRTARALENVQTQLDPRRSEQARAERRWVTPEEIATGREASPPPPPLRRVVEEEPEPVYHLRAYSNYLAPKLGLLSVDTWTMYSVYLRNLLLNQFILLPMMLAAIAVPRLLLLLFAHGTSQAMVTNARTWLKIHAGWPVAAVVLVASIAALTAPKLVDILARAIATRLGGRGAVWTILALWASGAAMLAPVSIGAIGPELLQPTLPGRPLHPVPLFAGLARTSAPVLLAVLTIVAVIGLGFRRRREGAIRRTSSPRVRGWAILIVTAIDLAALAWWPLHLHVARIANVSDWLTGDRLLFVATQLLACLGFARIYQTVNRIRESRQPSASRRAGGHAPPFNLPHPLLWEQILVPLALMSLGVSLLFSRPGHPYVVIPFFAGLSGWFDPRAWGGTITMPALCFGLMVGLMRLGAFLIIDLREEHHRAWRPFEHLGRAASAFASGVVAGALLGAVMTWLSGSLYVATDEGALTAGRRAATLLAIGPLCVLIAVGVGSALEVGLVGDYGEEDMREWRASLGAYLLLMGLLWAGFALLSLYGPLLAWWITPLAASATGAVWAGISALGALAGRSARTDGGKGPRGPNLLEHVAVLAPPVFLVGLVVAIAMLAAVLQDVTIPFGKDPRAGGRFLDDLTRAGAVRTWIILLGSAWLATVGCLYVNVNLFALNAFYANRLVRCYLGASRPKGMPAEGRPNYAPTNSPVPMRRPNPITGFDPTDDFPIRDLTIVRSWRPDDLVVDYRGPYHLVNTAMNLVAGDELAWQERMAESFVLSPLYCGSKTTGYRKAHIFRRDLEDDEVEPEEQGLDADEEATGYGGDVRLGTAVSVSGAAASPNAGYHSSPLVTILMTVFNARLGLWFGNPSRRAWRRSGPGFALYLFDELFGRTTSKGKYVYLSDGGHFENLGVYELVRRRCRYVVLCDAGADPELSFWDLGSLVRKCREDFGVRIEIDINPIHRKEGTVHGRWHCAVGRIHYEDVDSGAMPGTLLYIKPSLTGDEPSDVRNYVVHHATFPHETTADQFFSESQFESYRVLGEHIAKEVFGDAVEEAGPARRPGALFSSLRRRWFPPPPDLDKNFLEAVKPFVEVHRTLRQDPQLAGLSLDLYPELDQSLGNGNGAAPTGHYPRKEVHAVIEMLQAMENAWLALSLSTSSDHPLNRGWMNVFRRWTSAPTFQRHWPAVRGEFSEGFVRFCESELNLAVDPPRIFWLDTGPGMPGGLQAIPRAQFCAGLQELDGEFLLEWPEIVFPEIGDGRSGLMDMFEHGLSYPAGPNAHLRAALIRSDGAGNPAAAPPTVPRAYGVILTWASPDGPIELVIWLRGAYRTLRLGDALRDCLDLLRDDLRGAFAGGYVLRARYPMGQRGDRRSHWQSGLWFDFFVDRGFHPAGPRGPGDNWLTLISRFDPV